MTVHPNLRRNLRLVSFECHFSIVEFVKHFVAEEIRDSVLLEGCVDFDGFHFFPNCGNLSWVFMSLLLIYVKFVVKSVKKKNFIFKKRWSQALSIQLTSNNLHHWKHTFYYCSPIERSRQFSSLCDRTRDLLSYTSCYLFDRCQWPSRLDHGRKRICHPFSRRRRRCDRNCASYPTCCETPPGILGEVDHLWTSTCKHLWTPSVHFEWCRLRQC